MEIKRNKLVSDKSIMKNLLTILLLVLSFSAMGQTWTVGTNVGANGGYPVKPAHFIDLSNYAGRQKNRPGMMYDAFGYTNPAYGNLQFAVNASGVKGDTTPFMPENQFPEFYINGFAKATTYQGNRGCRVIYDWSGDKNEFDTSHRTTIKALYGAENSFDAGDTLFFYNIDFTFGLAADQRAKYLARPDSLLTPVAYLISHGALHTWTSVTTNFTCRYMLVRAVLKDHGGYKTTESFQEVAFYGTRPSDSAAGAKRPTAANYTGPLPKKSMFKNFDGTDLINGIRVDTLRFNGTVRIYGGKNYWANTVSGGGSASTEVYTFDHFADIGPTQYPQYKAAGIKMWWSIRGVSSWFAANYSSSFEQPVDIDHQTDEGEYGLNFTREARFYFHYAAKFGAVAVSSSFTPGWTGDGSYPNGQNTIFGVEPNNEYEFKGITPLMIVNHVNAVYDGYESRYGSHTGVKNADPNFTLILPASVERDTSLIESMIWLFRYTRTDKGVAFDWVNVHHYPCDLNDLPGSATYDQQLGASGRSPEADHLYADNLLYTKFVYNLLDGDTTKKITNSETGYDNIDSAQHIPVGNPGWRSDYSYHNLAGVTIPTYTALQSKAVVMSRLESIQAASGLAYQQEFAFSNSDLGTTIQPSIYTSPGMTSGYNGATFIPTGFYPWWYYHAGKHTVLKDYYVDTTYSGFGTTGVNICRWKSDIHTDSVIYEIWKGTVSNTTSSSTLTIPGLASSTLAVFKSSFVSTNPIVSSTTASSGVLSYTATEEPMYYRAAVGTISIPSCTTNLTPAPGATVSGTTTATLTVSASSGATFYDWFVYPGGTPPSFPSYSTSGTTLNATGLTPASVYHFYARPGNSAGSPSGCATSNTQFSTAVSTVIYLRVYRKP
jgi:hypothetical protein